MFLVISIILPFVILAALVILIIGIFDFICGHFVKRCKSWENIKADLKKQSKRFGVEMSDEDLDKMMDKAYEDAENDEYKKSPVEEMFEEGRRRANEYAASKYWFDMFNKN